MEVGLLELECDVASVFPRDQDRKATHSLFSRLN